MTTEVDYEGSLKTAERDFANAKTADDVRQVWKNHFSVLGHRTLGRLLLGRSADELIERRSARSEKD